MLLATKTYLGFHVNFSIFLPIFNQIWNLLTALPVGTELIQTERTDGQT